MISMYVCSTGAFKHAHTLTSVSQDAVILRLPNIFISQTQVVPDFSTDVYETKTACSPPDRAIWHQCSDLWSDTSWGFSAVSRTEPRSSGHGGCSRWALQGDCATESSATGRHPLIRAHEQVCGAGPLPSWPCPLFLEAVSYFPLSPAGTQTLTVRVPNEWWTATHFKKKQSSSNPTIQAFPNDINYSHLSCQ